MTDITRILSPQCTRSGIAAKTRKRALEAASDLLCEVNTEMSPRALFDELLARERLGSTGLGEGVAIPHCRTSCKEIVGAFLKLDEPVDYDAADGEPVDLLFVLVVPAEETQAHLDVLATLARLFSDADNRSRLRSTNTSAELYEALIGLLPSLAA